MKKLLTALLFVPTLALAQEANPYSFSITDASYVFLPTSVRNIGTKDVPKVVALWDVNSAPYSWRWTVTVSDCNKAFGTIQIADTPKSVNTHAWSIDGTRAYDHLAFNSCLAYYMGQKQ